MNSIQHPDLGKPIEIKDETKEVEYNGKSIPVTIRTIKTDKGKTLEIGGLIHDLRTKEYFLETVDGQRIKLD